MSKDNTACSVMLLSPRIVTRRMLCFLVLVVPLLAVNVLAQVETATVLGTVTDESGAVIPNVSILLVNEGTGLQFERATGGSGNYIFTPVQIGTYTVTARMTGFDTQIRPHVQVNIQQSVVVDFTLRPGRVTQTVAVTGAVPLLQTQDASVGQVVGGQQINDLPLNGRNYVFLAQLAPGVTQMQQDTRGLGASGGLVANGTRSAQDNYLIDGIDNNNIETAFLNGYYYVVRPPIDALSEFKVQTGDYSAEFGRSAGGVINATLKSGTNQWHGDAWEFLRNSGMDAPDFFEDSAGLPKGEYRQNQFGFTVGGPIRKGKTFVFGDYEGTRIRQAITYVSTVPTALERSSGYANFSDLVNLQTGSTPKDLLGRTFPLGTAFDPATTRPVTSGQIDPVTGLSATGTGFVRESFPGNLIPSGRVDTNAVKILNLLPTPTSSVLFNNYTDHPVESVNNDAFDVRVDQNFSDRNQMFARVSYDHNPRFIPEPFSGLAEGGNFNQSNQANEARNVVLSETYSFSPTLVNVIHYGFSRVRTALLEDYANASGIPGQYGIQGVPVNGLSGGLPQMVITGLTTLGSSTYLPNVNWTGNYQISDDLTKVHGSHTLKAGFEFMHINFAILAVPYGRGTSTYSGVYTSIPGANVGSTGIAQFVLTPEASTVTGGINNDGGPNSINLSNFAGSKSLRQYFAGYIQDDWKVRSKFTLNLGVRYEYFSPITEKYGAQSNFINGTPFSGAEYLIPATRQNPSGANNQISTSVTQTLQSNGIALNYVSNPALLNAQKTNLGPRFGFAYRATPRLVVRGGYGLFYGGFELIGGGNSLQRNYPFQYAFGFANSSPTAPIIFSDGANATTETEYANIPLTGSVLSASGLTLYGIAPNLKTAYTQDANLFLQYQLTPNTSLQMGYVGTTTRHLQVTLSPNATSQLLTTSTSFTPYLPFPSFSTGTTENYPAGNAYYNSLQANLERRFSGGLNFLGNYTCNKYM